MIVSDQSATIIKANEISENIILLFIEEAKKTIPKDDPAEQIYLWCHTIGNLLAKTAIVLENYGEIYDIKNLGNKSIIEWIVKISEEHIEANKQLGKTNEVE